MLTLRPHQSLLWHWHWYCTNICWLLISEPLPPEWWSILTKVLQSIQAWILWLGLIHGQVYISQQESYVTLLLQLSFCNSIKCYLPSCFLDFLDFFDFLRSLVSSSIGWKENFNRVKVTNLRQMQIQQHCYTYKFGIIFSLLEGLSIFNLSSRQKLSGSRNLQNFTWTIFCGKE